MGLFKEMIKDAFTKNSGNLEAREIVQIAARVIDLAAERLDDGKLSPAEIYELLALAYEQYNKEAND